MARQTAINTADDMGWLRDVHPLVTDVPVIFKADDEGVFRETKRKAASTGRHHASTKRHHATKKLPAQLQREIDEVLANASSFKIGDAVQFRSEPGTGGIIRRFEPNGWARVATPRGARTVPTYALVLVRKEHEPRVRRSVENR